MAEWETRLLEELGRCLLDFVAKEDETMVKLLLEHEQKGLFINYEDAEKGKSALMIATKRGYIGMVELLLHHGADVNRKFVGRREKVTWRPSTEDYEVGTTALMMASMNIDIDIAKLLLDHGADVNLKDGKGVSPLIISCSSENDSGLELARLLLEHGADVNPIKGYEKELVYPLMVASKWHNIEMADLLLKRASIDALTTATKNRNLEMAKLLLEQGASIGVALTTATKNRDLEMAKLLLEQGAAIDKAIRDALIIAVETRDLEMAKLLIDSENIAVKNYRDPKNIMDKERAPTLTIVTMDRDLKRARLLREAKAPDYSEIRHALTTAIVNGDLEMAKLLEQRAPIVQEIGHALITAVVTRDLEMTKLLLEQVAPIDREIRHALLQVTVIVNRDFEMAKLFLETEQGTIVDVEKGSTLLTMCEDQNLQMAELFIKHGADVNFRSQGHGWTALMKACKTEHLETIKFLLEHGADTNVQDDKGISALMIACKSGQTEVVELLLKYGASIHLRAKDGKTALIIASENGFCNIVELLLRSGADILYENICTALIFACQNGHSQIVKLLLECGGDVNWLYYDRKISALMSAVKENFVRAAKVLLDHGADINLQNDEGTTALMTSAQIGDTEMTKLLLDHGANVNLQDDGKYSALMFAGQNGHDRVARLLVEYGADVNVEKDNQWSPLMFLISSGKEHVQTVKMFLGKGARINAQGKDGWTALMLACNTSHTETVDLLIKLDADVNMQRRLNGQTALMIASQNGDIKTVETLLKHGANVNIKDNNGATASMFARQNRRTEIVKLLEMYEAMSTASVVLASPKSPYPALNSIHEVTSEDLTAETVLLVTNSEQYFSWHEYGLQIYISEHSLPEDVDQCGIHIKVSIMGDYQLPQDVHLVSAVYSIKCIPKCQFSKPLILEIQHCAKPENTHKLCFIKSKTGSNFNIIDGDEGVQTDMFGSFFPQHSSYAFLELDKFCETAIGQKGTAESPRYRANVYHREEDARQHTFHFNIVQDTNAHNELVCQHYGRKSMELQRDQEVEFEEDKIKLDIPFPSEEGITTKNEAWSILSLTPPVITKIQVDSFGKGKRIPSCHLQVDCRKEVPSDLNHVVHLKGAKSPEDAFIISVSARRKRQHDRDFEPRAKHPKTAQEEMTFSHLLNLSSKVSPRWEDVGLCLGIDPDHLDIIKYKNQDCQDCFREMIKVWYKRVNPCPEWSAIIDAIELTGYEALAEELRQKYIHRNM